MLDTYFSILIADDRLGKEHPRELELVRCYLDSVTRDTLPEVRYVEIETVQSSYAVLRCLKERWFDLVLLDCDFSRAGDDLTGNVDKDVREFFDLLLGPTRTYHGIILEPILRALRGIQTAGCYLWTVLSVDELREHYETVHSLPSELVVVEKPSGPPPDNYPTKRGNVKVLPMNEAIEEAYKYRRTLLTDNQRGDPLPVELARRFHNAVRSAAVAGDGNRSIADSLTVFDHVIAAKDQALTFLQPASTTSDAWYLTAREPLEIEPSVCYRISPKRVSDDLRRHRCLDSRQYEFPEFKPSGNEEALHDAEPLRLLASCPLTSVSIVDSRSGADVLLKKVLWLLRGPWDSIVLKTVYLDDPNQNQTDGSIAHLQSRMKTRCVLGDGNTLWNSGKTSSEAMTPSELADFLERLAADDGYRDLVRRGRDSEIPRVIPSLGSKYPEADALEASSLYELFAALTTVWGKLFNLAFPEKNDAFSVVEINVRHYLRENLRRWTGGDEYMNPATFGEKPVEHSSLGIEEFRGYLNVIQDVALEYRKKVILKMPFRSDLVAYVREAWKVREARRRQGNEHGIYALTLTNTIKSPTQEGDVWAAQPSVWPDGARKQDMYQMSGGLLSSARDQAVRAALTGLPSAWDMPVFVSGGVVSKKQWDSTVALLRRLKQASAQAEAQEERGFPNVTGIQLATAPLLAYSSAINEFFGWEPHIGKPSGGLKRSRRPRELRGDVSARQSSGIREREFAARLVTVDRSRCVACGFCSDVYYCDAFFDRTRFNRAPALDARNCSGCGLCVQQCPRGALHLRSPEEFVMIVRALDAQITELEAANKAYLRMPARSVANGQEGGEVFKIAETMLREAAETGSVVGSELAAPTRVLGLEHLVGVPADLLDIAIATIADVWGWGTIAAKEPGKHLAKTPVVAVTPFVRVPGRLLATPSKRAEVDESLRLLASEPFNVGHVAAVWYSGTLAVDLSQSSDGTGAFEICGEWLDSAAIGRYAKMGYGVNATAGLDVEACRRDLVRSAQDKSALGKSERAALKGTPKLFRKLIADGAESVLASWPGTAPSVDA